MQPLYRIIPITAEYGTWTSSAVEPRGTCAAYNNGKITFVQRAYRVQWLDMESIGTSIPPFAKLAQAVRYARARGGRQATAEEISAFDAQLEAFMRSYLDRAPFGGAK